MLLFVVEGLVLVGGNASGTPGRLTSVRGTLVCNPGLPQQITIDTPLVPLSSQGNAAFIGTFDGQVATFCINPLSHPRRFWRLDCHRCHARTLTTPFLSPPLRS